MWCSGDFERASGLIRRKATDGYRAAFANALSTPAGIRAALAILRTPVTTVRLCAEDVAHLLDFVPPAGRRVFSGRTQFAHFVLDVPATEREYLAGKSRQALRTNLRRAARAGIKCVRVSCYEEWRPAAEAILSKRDAATGRGLLDVIGPPPPHQRIAFYVARDAHDQPVAFGGAVMFGDLAYLFTLLTARDHPEARTALWALNGFVVVECAADGIRFLTTGSALRDTTHGTQYLAHLLGYRVRNLRFARQ